MCPNASTVSISSTRSIQRPGLFTSADRFCKCLCRTHIAVVVEVRIQRQSLSSLAAAMEWSGRVGGNTPAQAINVKAHVQRVPYSDRTGTRRCYREPAGLRTTRLKVRLSLRGFTLHPSGTLNSSSPPTKRSQGLKIATDTAEGTPERTQPRGGIRRSLAEAPRTQGSRAG